MTRAGVWVVGALAPLLLISRAHAAGRVVLAYDAAAGCASETEFKGAVESRGGNFNGPGAPGSAWALRVSIVRDAGGFHGTLQATNDDATSALREVHGATCPEVVDALAVVSATALNPQAESTSARNEPPPTRQVAAAAPAASATSPAPVAPEPAPTTTTFSQGRLRATRSLINAQLPVQAGTLRVDYARAVTLYAGVQLGMVPNTVMPRYELSFDGASFITTPGGNTFLHGVVPRVRLSYAGQGTYETQDTTSAINAFTFALGACWAPTYDTQGWVALLCGEYGAGWVNVLSKDLNGTKIQNKTTGLGLAGLNLETRYNLGSLFQIGLKLGMDVMVGSFSAERANGSRIFESQQFLGYGMLGFGAHF